MSMDPETVMGPQVLVYALTPRLQQRGMETEQRIINGMTILSSGAHTGTGLKYSQFNTTSCSVTKASQHNCVRELEW